MKTARAAGPFLVLALSQSVAFAEPLCLPGEGARACVARVSETRCAKARIKIACKAAEALKLMPEVVVELAKSAASTLSSVPTKLRELVAKGIALIGQDKKVDPRWRGEFCTNDSYGMRFTRDVNFDGLANFGIVEPGVLYRGSQPFTLGVADPQGRRGNGYDTLKKLGVTCRILLRTTTFTDELVNEATELKKRGIKLVHLPVPLPAFGPPLASIPDPARFFFTKALERARDQMMEVVTSKKYGPCYISCQSARHRTNILVGWYRAAVQKWKVEKIFREWEDCQFDGHGIYAYYQRLFCKWYTDKFGADPTCAKLAK
jgi:hypothetical protein